MHTRNTDVAHAGHEDESAASPASRRVRGAAAALATTVGAAAVVTTALAPAAEAKSHHTVWDKVAQCESTNRWHISTGNGFYGGLQFTDSTWDAYGGNTYAGRADNASRLEQIEVARRVLHAQGRNAWPVCGPRAGLTRSSGHATGANVPRVVGTAPSSTHHHHKAKHAAHQTAKHHSHRGKHRAGDTYRVTSGDTLSSIARAHHVHGGWQALYRANRSHLSNPNVIHVGQHLNLP